MSSGDGVAAIPSDLLVTHSGVRFFPPDGPSERWRVTNLLTCETLACSRLAVAVLVSFLEGASRAFVIAELNGRYAEPSLDIETAIDALEDLQLIVAPNLPSHKRFEQLSISWARFGWIDSADYHLSTRNYPFLDYSLQGSREDRSRMAQYAQSVPDLNRYKSYGQAAPRFAAPSTHAALEALDVEFLTMWTSIPELQILNRARVLTLMSAVFGQLASRTLSNRPDLMADAVLKTSPSGGARHPTEGYLFALSVDGLAPGIYHFNVKDGTLDRLAELNLDAANIFGLFSGPLRAKFEVDAFIVLSSVFERNMYRYREPRTFRTVLMDVGHLLGTSDIVAKSLGINCLVQHGIDDRELGKLLNLNPLVEGVIWAIALGGAKASASGRAQAKAL